MTDSLTTNSLVQRLRAEDKHSTTGPQVERDRLFYKAAVEIERLCSENRRLAGRLAGSLALNVLTRTADETSEGT